MGKYNRERFTHICLHRSTQRDLDSFRISYGIDTMNKAIFHLLRYHEAGIKLEKRIKNSSENDVL